MLVTAVEKRKKGMSALFVEGEYLMSVDTVTLMSSGIKAGADVIEDELEELKEKSDINRAKEKALYLIEYRARSRREITDKLVPLYGEAAAEAAVERLEELGLINDEDFARDLARQLMERKKYSAGRTVFELVKKGIDKELAEEITEELDDDPSARITEILNTRYRGRLSDEKGVNRAVSGLRAMGYSWYDIKDALYEMDIDI